MRWFTLTPTKPLKDFRREMAGQRLVRRYQRSLVSVPVDKVVGSLNKAGSMDRRFRHKNGKVDSRLSALREANEWAMVALPPIDLYQLGDEYYVVDGHHRMALALENHQVEIEANVVVHELEPVATPQPAAGWGARPSDPLPPSARLPWLAAGSHRLQLPTLTPWFRRWQAVR
jgi:hypothetical protein